MTPDALNPEWLLATFHHGATVARITVALGDTILMTQGNVDPPAALQATRSEMADTFALGNPK